jgi:hypothetical protein
MLATIFKPSCHTKALCKMGEALFFYLHARARNRFQKNGLELKIIVHAAPLPSSREFIVSVHCFKKSSNSE